MKRFATIIIIALTCMAASAQRAYPSFDAGVRQIKLNGFPDFSYTVDNYLQYSPAVVMAGMKAFGYESRSSWGRMAVSDAFSVAIMTALVNGTKYTVRRMRPDGTSRNSFPSGHTATSFMLATMLHKEYGWRSPWFSFGGYAVASVTGISRIINDRHWASDVIAGAVVGIAATQLGYLISDKIFKERYIAGNYAAPSPELLIDKRYYNLGMYFGYRFIIGKEKLSTASGNSFLTSGSTVGLEARIPVIPCSGVCVRASCNSLFSGNGSSFNSYSFMAGGCWNRPFLKIMEAEACLLAGYSIFGNQPVVADNGLCNGLDITARACIGILAGENFKIKAFAEYETIRFSRQKPFIHSIVAGGSAVFLW